jgi:hypothetical protein
VARVTSANFEALFGIPAVERRVSES